MSTPTLSDDDLRLVRWLVAGHQNERDADVQKLFRKCERIIESRHQTPATETVRDVFED